MSVHRHDDLGEVSSAQQGPVDPTPPPPVDRPPPKPAAPPPPVDAPSPPALGSHATPGPDTPPGPEARPPRRTHTAWLVGAAAACLVAAAVVLGLRSWDLDGQVSDLTDENDALATDNESLEGEVADLTDERDSIREIFPLAHAAFADADLAGTYDFLFVPVEGKCTYSDCDQIGAVTYPLRIARAADGYTVAIAGGPGEPASMSRDGDVYSASGVLPESMWGVCGDTPAETSFELHLSVEAVGLADGNLRAVEAGGTYRQYTRYDNLGCAPSESTSTFTGHRAG